MSGYGKTRLEIDIKKLRQVAASTSVIAEVLHRQMAEQANTGQSYLNDFEIGALVSVIALVGDVVDEVAEGLERITDIQVGGQ